MTHFHLEVHENYLLKVNFHFIILPHAVLFLLSKERRRLKWTQMEMNME